MGPDSDVLPVLLEDYWSDFERSLARRGRSKATASAYRDAYEKFWNWALSAEVEADPAQVTYKTMNEWTSALLETVAARNGRPQWTTDKQTGEKIPKLLAPSTRRILWANLRPFFSWFSREEGVEHPFDKADPPPVAKNPVIPVVELDDLRRVLATCSDPHDFTDRRDEALIRLLIDTGARRGEIVGLRLTDFDRRNDLVALDGKTGPRVVPVSLRTGEALARYIRRRAKHSRAEHPALWLGKAGPLGNSGIAQILKARCELAGVEHINPHRLRHSWAHLFRAEGGSEGDLMFLAGWQSTEMAHRYGRSAAAERAQTSARAISIGDKL